MADRGAEEFEPHTLDRADFYGQVQSFEFWFETVEGYLADRPYGYDPTTEPDQLDDARRDSIITLLCNYCVGESAALEASGGMVTLAPNHNARIFMATQVADEARHLEVFLHRLGELGVEDQKAEIVKRAHPAIVSFRQRLLDLVSDGDWEAAVFAQNVILETMEFTVFQYHADGADRITRQVLEGVISDERRHLGFGENDIGRRLARRPDLGERIQQVRRDLDPLVLGSFEGALDDLGVPRSQRPELARDYLAAVERIGLGE